jgi:putative flippase GtrA
MTTSTDSTPVPKVVAAGATGAVTIILVWLAGQAGIEIPPEVASSITTVCSFITGYLAPRRGA